MFTVTFVYLSLIILIIDICKCKFWLADKFQYFVIIIIIINRSTSEESKPTLPQRFKVDFSLVTWASTGTLSG